MAAVGGIAAGVLAAIPLVGDFISGVAFVFTLGYIIQIIRRNAHLKSQQPANTPELPHRLAANRHKRGQATLWWCTSSIPLHEKKCADHCGRRPFLLVAIKPSA